MDIFDFFDTTGHPTYIFFTADHGELTGQNGRFGHNQVDLDIANVPFLFYGANVSEKRITALADDLGNLPNHYVISKKIAALLGYKITNPNEKDGKFYLNGTSVFGEAGFIEYDIKEVKKQYGIDSKRLSAYAKEIKNISDTGVQVAIVIGGGNIYRGIQSEGAGFDRVQGDHMGMLATIINGMALQSALESLMFRPGFSS
jgi:hypothetical protein